ncbi:hypothetical protein MCT05_04320 [Vibrio aestuarianus]|nr:hypothetical protein [Vibrio aestuarianus]
MQNWQQLREAYRQAYQDSQITLAKWCKENQLDYQCARKQIKVKEIKAEFKKVIKTKRQKVIDPQPQKANTTSFKANNQVARVHGGYASLLNQDDVEIAQQIESLEDELLACRSRLVSVIKQRTELEGQLQNLNGSDLELKAHYMEVHTKIVDAEDRVIARIESITATLAKVERSQISNDKDKLQSKLIQQTIDQKSKVLGVDDKVTYIINW